ncbi:MAG: GH3 auxin-responsive promoter family protein [Cytophagales bacterium]|nr:GH3 auxin-responsive promoter family protein [Cytophagales bacterium]
MSVKSTLIKIIARYITQKNNLWAMHPTDVQHKIFKKLINKAKYTQYGKAHNFSSINTYEEFKKYVPISDYEDIKPYIDQILSGAKDILWPGKPLYFAKTSGTTSGTKYIPISKDSIGYHIASARDALFAYVAETGNADFFDGKLIFLSGSPEIEKKQGIFIGRLSGIVNHHVPGWIRANQMPKWSTNCIEDWETKVETIVDETLTQNMTLISGIPPWVQMYFDKITIKTGKKICDVFPNFKLFVYGGVNFEPYRAKLSDSIGKKIDAIETYPASEGFIAYQNAQNDSSMLLLLNSGMFYEFIPAAEYHSPTRTRISIKDVKIGVNYALIINSNAGLWGYSIGDTIKFVSLYPHKIVVTGRIKHFISAFGEHVIAEEVEKAMNDACTQSPETEIVEFTVAPQVAPIGGELPHHEWLIAFDKIPNDLEKFAINLDEALQKYNSYYYDLITGHVLQRLKIIPLPGNAFIEYMKSKGKLGGQNKVPRLTNDRIMADELVKVTKI